MIPIETEYNKLINQITSSHAAIAGQMFGKKCIKISGKAGIALFKDCIVFKLPEPDHKKAISLAGSILWDPSGKGRAMKEWVQITLDHKTKFKKFAQVAADYVAEI